MYSISLRLRTIREYYFKLQKVETFQNVKDLIVSDKLFNTLDCDTATHIVIRQAEGWFTPANLAK